MPWWAAPQDPNSQTLILNHGRAQVRFRMLLPATLARWALAGAAAAPVCRAAAPALPWAVCLAWTCGLQAVVVAASLVIGRALDLRSRRLFLARQA